MSTGESTFGAPRGMRDFYPEDMPLRERIFGAWRDTSRLFGFEPYDACVVETLDLLKRKAGEEIVEQIYAFADKSGRELALRPEMTPTLARMVAARQGALAFPLKWYTIAQCFRYERMTKGRKREHYQWNLDVIGEDSVAAEAEVVAAAAHALLALGLSRADFRVHFSSRALLSAILSRQGVPPQSQAAVCLALDKRGRIGDEEVRAMLAAAGLSPATADRVFDVFRAGDLAEAQRLLGERLPCLDAVEEFSALAAAYGLADVVRFDISVVRGLAYYTGIVFEAFDAQRRFRAIFGGGRYDNLLREVGGRPATGVGLGFGDVVVAELLSALGRDVAPRRPSGIAVGFMEEAQRHTAVLAAAAFRRRGERTDLALRPERAKAFFSRCDRGGFARAVYIGPDDAAAGTVRVKDLAARSEREVALSALLSAGQPSGAAPEAAAP